MILFFFFNDTATTEIYTLSLHDALPILQRRAERCLGRIEADLAEVLRFYPSKADRKSTRLNSSHGYISYAVFCLKKKKKKKHKNDGLYRNIRSRNTANLATREVESRRHE